MPDVFGGEAHQAPRHVERILARLQHAGQPVEAGVGVGVADRLVQRADDVEVLLAALVVEERLARERVLHGGQVHAVRALGVRRRVGDRHLEHVERRARVAVGRRGQEGERVVGRPRGAARPGRAPRRRARGAARDSSWRRVERLEDDHAAPRQERGVDLERRVLGGGADEGHVAGLDVAEERVLLRLVVAVDLVDEEDGAPALAGASRSSAWRRTSRSSLTPESTALRASKCEVVRWRTTWASVVLPEPGGPQRMIEGKSVRFDGAPQGPPFAEDLFLSDQLVQGLGADALGQGRVLVGLSGGTLTRRPSRGGEEQARAILAAPRHPGSVPRSRIVRRADAHALAGRHAGPRPRPGCRRRRALARRRRGRAGDGVRPVRVPGARPWPRSAGRTRRRSSATPSASSRRSRSPHYGLVQALMGQARYAEAADAFLSCRNVFALARRMDAAKARDMEIRDLRDTLQALAGRHALTADRFWRCSSRSAWPSCRRARAVRALGPARRDHGPRHRVLPGGRARGSGEGVPGRAAPGSCIRRRREQPGRPVPGHGPARRRGSGGGAGREAGVKVSPRLRDEIRQRRASPSPP